MAPIKSSLARSVGKLLGVFRDRDLSLRGTVQSSRFVIQLISASGGTETSPGNGYKYHTFTSPGTFTVTESGDIEFLAVAGGGSGGFAGGGGGGGGVVHVTGLTVSTAAYPITIGPGSTGGALPSPARGEPGGDTTCFGFTANGGGGGGGPGSPTSGIPGGSGGGDPGGNQAPATQPTQPQPASGTLNQYGFPGGWLNASPSPTVSDGSGGGGATERGSHRTENGAGGDGIQFPQFTGPLIGVPALNPLNGYFAGGGGGGNRDSRPRPAGGAGGGGAGGNTSSTIGAAGVSNSGGGGGGGGTTSGVGNASGGDGGSGIVVIRYAAS